MHTCFFCALHVTEIVSRPTSDREGNREDCHHPWQQGSQELVDQNRTESLYFSYKYTDSLSDYNRSIPISISNCTKSLLRYLGVFQQEILCNEIQMCTFKTKSKASLHIIPTGKHSCFPLIHLAFCNKLLGKCIV